MKITHDITLVENFSDIPFELEAVLDTIPTDAKINRWYLCKVNNDGSREITEDYAFSTTHDYLLWRDENRKYIDWTACAPFGIKFARGYHLTIVNKHGKEPVKL